MRNRALHDALREFALDAAALLSDEQRAGAELEFEVEDERRGRGPALYRYRPLTGRFIAQRWEGLRGLPSCVRAASALGSGAAAWLRASGAHAVSGEQAEPALQAMAERLYEDATSFAFPEERFERVYRDVEATLYRDTVRTAVAAPMRGLVLERERVELGDGLALVRGDAPAAPPEAAWEEDGPAALCLLERDVALEEPEPVIEAEQRFRSLLTCLRLLKPGGVALAALGWRRSGEGRWTPVELEPGGVARGERWHLRTGEEDALRELLGALRRRPGGALGWALGRFEMGSGRPTEAEALSDHLLGLRAMLDAADDAGRASLGLRLAALCAEEGERRATQRRLERALALERFLMGGGGELARAIGSDSPRALVAETEGHLRALLRDVICGYLDADLGSVADDILLETSGAAEPFAIEARDLRRERAPERRESDAERARSAPPGGPVGAERRPAATFPEVPAPPAATPPEAPMPPAAAFPDAAEPPAATVPEAVAAAPAAGSRPAVAVAAPALDGVTPSADGADDDPGSFSAPV
ncbi:MAG: hypothetical protein ACM3UV_02680 [Nocardioidaceae bacterium]